MKDHGAAVDIGVASDEGHAWFFSVFTIGNIDFENIRGRAFFDIGDSPVMSWIGQLNRLPTVNLSSCYYDML